MIKSLVLLVGAALAIEMQTRTPIARVVRETTIDVLVESLHIVNGQTSVLATHTLRDDAITPIDILETPEHWIRFTPAHGKPLIVRAPDLLAADLWHVQNLESRATLGIWASPADAARVPKGAVVITGEAAACATARTFRLGVRLTAGMRMALPIMGTDDVARCRWLFLSLAPASYEAALLNPRGSSGRADFTVVAGETIEVVIPPSAVTVSGIASINKQRITEGQLQFQKAMTAATLVRIEPDGTYNLALDEDGLYSVTVRVPYKFFKPFTTTFVPGTNTFDIDIEDAEADTRLTVRVTGADRLLPTEIEIRSQNGLTSGSIPAGSDTFERRGLPFGTHRLSARQPDRSSDWQEFALSAAEPSATAALALGRATRSITLRYEDGEPVVSAGFSNTSARPEETTPGTYSLASVAPNTELVVRPPTGAPICRVVPATGDVQAVVVPGRSITLRFANRRVSVDEVRVMAEGSDCSVPLARFLKSSFRAGPNQTVEVDVLNAPPDEVLMIHTGTGAYRAIVPADGVVLVGS